MISIQEHKLKGTYRAKRHAEKEKTEVIIQENLSFPVGTIIETPAEITDESVKKTYQEHINQLTFLQLLTPADLPELDEMYLTLQQLKKVRKELEKENVINDLEKYEKLTSLSLRLGKRFSDIAKKYYISPVARVKLKLENETLKQKQLESVSVIQKLIAEKRG